MGDIHIRIDEEPIIIRMEPASIYPIPFTSLTDAPTTYHDQANKFVKVKAAEDGLEFVVAAGLTDELVKYDAGDTVPGYLADKIIAGTGISLSEGTGADENKLKITGTASYTLPIATASILGGVKEGSGVTIGVDGTISAAGTYTLPIATGSTLGGIKVGTRLSIDGSGVLSADVQTTDISGKANVIHNLIDTTNHPVTGLTIGHFLKAFSATTYGFAAHGLGFADVGAAASNHDHSGTYEPHDDDLTAIAALGFASVSFLTKTAANTWSLDTNSYSLSTHVHSGTYLPVAGAGDIYTHNASEFLTSVTAHNLLSATHGDTTSGSCARGSIIVGDSNSKWVNLAFPGTPIGKVLIATATDVEWSTNALGTAAYTAATAYEVPLTFGSGVTRTVNAVANDLITGKSGGQTAYGGIAQTEALTLQGNIATASGTNIAGGDVYIKATPGTGTGISSIHFFTGTTLTTGNTLQTLSEKMTILGSGNVGIGNITPSSKLDVTGVINTSSSFSFASVGNINSTGFSLSSSTGIEYTNNNTTAGGHVFRINSGGTLRDIVRFQRNGNVGIGIGFTTPIGNLQIQQGIIGIGTVTITGTTTCTGTGTQFLNTFKVGDSIIITATSETKVISAIASDTVMTIAAATNTSGSAYTLTGGSRFIVLGNGNVGFNGITAPTAMCHLPASTATAGTSALKFTPATSVLLTAPEIGAFEPVTDDISYTISTGTARKQLVMTDGTLLTSGRIPFAYTNGRLIDSSTLTYSASTGLATALPLTFGTASSGVVLKQGANGKCGTFVANGITPVTVSNTSIAITDCIIISLNTVGGTVGMQPTVATITAATGFTVICTVGDTSTYNYAIISNAN